MTTFDEPPEFDVGDRVVTTQPIGRRWGHRILPGAPGTVIARTADRLIAVRFEDGRVEHVHPAVLAWQDEEP